MAKSKKRPSSAAARSPARSAGPEEAAPAPAYAPRVPLQSDGVDRGAPSIGGPARIGRQGVALQVLANPTARNSFSRVYSGQTARQWRR